MIKIENPLVAVPVKFGLLGSGVSILMFLVIYWMGRNPLIDLTFFNELGFFYFLLLPVFLFFSMKEFRDYRNNGISHFWQGMTVGVITYLSLGITYALFVYLFISTIDSEVHAEYVEYLVQTIENQKEEFIAQFDEQLYNETLETNRITSHFRVGLDIVWKISGIGMMLTVPIAIFLRRREL